MAKKKTHARKRRHTATPTKKHHKRRRMSAGAGTFKMLSNPIFGGIVGGAAGILLKNVIKKAMNNEMIATVAPLAVGFLIRKKAPMVSAGMIAVPALSYIGTKVPMLAEGGNVTFADNLLLSGNEYTLNENLYLSDEYTMNDMEEESTSFADYSMEEE